MLALEIRELYKTYTSGVTAVKGINLSVNKGDFFALLGPNGAGKSTTIGIVASLVNKTSGQVKIFDYDLDKNLLDARASIGLVPQEFNFNQFEKVFDIVVNQAGYYGVPSKKAKINTEKYLRQLDLWDKRNTIARNLSGGMKRRLMIARALVHEPKMLILDEPTAGVDIELRRSMWSFLQDINNQGITIILTTHYLEEAEYLCKGIAIIDHGKIVANTTIKDILKQLQIEVVLIDLQKPYFELPKLENYTIYPIDQNTIEVSFSKNHGLNELFLVLNQHGMLITSVRNKRNRLEELFLQFISNPESNV